MNYNIVFVCTGNACRSPFAETVLKQLLRDANIENVDVWSCGTLDWGVNPRDAQMVQTAIEMGYTMDGTTRCMRREDLVKADKIIVFGHYQRDEVTHILDYDHWKRITLFDMYAFGVNNEVRDPHYESPAIYKDVAVHIEEGCKAIVGKIVRTILCPKEDNSKANKQILVCAPSGAGKTTLIKFLLSELGNELGFCVSVTTRQPRVGETNGESYEFVDREQFESYIEDNALLEYEQVYQGTYYGTLAKNVEDIDRQNKIPLFDVDVKGAVRLKAIYGSSMKTIFIMPPSVEELRRRLVQRGTDSMEKIQERVTRAELEMSYRDQFDYILVNDDIDKSKTEILKIVREHIFSS